MKKKCLSLLMTLVLLVCAAVPLSAAAEEDTPVPFGLNYHDCSMKFTISQYGVASINVSVIGNRNNVSRINTATYLERWEATATGLKWVTKIGPLKYDVTTYNLNKTWTKDLTINGDWRAVTQFTIYGNYPTESETILKYATYTV